MRQSNKGDRRRLLRPLFVFAALAAFAVILTPSGTAASNTKPFAAVFGATVAPDGSLPLTITDETKNQQLGSANVTAPAGVTIVGTSAPAGNLDPSQQFPAQTLMLRNLNLDPPSGPASFSTTIYVSASSCGAFAWSIQAHQSNDYNSQPGNTMTLDTGNSQLNTVATGGCHLAWVHQPASADQSTPITDTAFAAGNSVAVAVEDASNTPINLNTGTATIAATGSFDVAGCNPNFINTTSTTFSAGVATFPTFQSQCTGTGFTATATALGLNTPASSPPFVIQPNGVNCANQNPCDINGAAGNGLVDVQGTGGNFVYLALSGASLPTEVTGTNGGCTNFTGTGTDFRETDARNGNGTLTVTLSITNQGLKTAYGPNYGQPNVPICVGVQHLVGNTAYPCTDLVNGGSAWADRTLAAPGLTFQGGYDIARCDKTVGSPGYGYWWGIVGTFQDPNPPFDPSSIPLITGWGSVGNYRTFTINVPGNWDMQGHG